MNERKNMDKSATNRSVTILTLKLASTIIISVLIMIWAIEAREITYVF